MKNFENLDIKENIIEINNIKYIYKLNYVFLSLDLNKFFSA